MVLALGPGAFGRISMQYQCNFQEPSPSFPLLVQESKVSKSKKKVSKNGVPADPSFFEKSKFFEVFFENPKIKVEITRAEDQVKPVAMSSAKITDLCGGGGEGEEERNLVCLKSWFLNNSARAQ